MPITQRIVSSTLDAYLGLHKSPTTTAAATANGDPKGSRGSVGSDISALSASSFNPLTDKSNGEDLLRDQTFSRTLGCLTQLSELASYSNEIFSELTNLTTAMHGRIQNLTTRTSTISQRLETIRLKKETLLLDTRSTGTAAAGDEELLFLSARQMIQKPQSHNMVNKENMPMCIMRAYEDEKMRRMLPLYILDEHKACLTNGDKIDSVTRCYSNPDFFLREWVQRETKRMDELSKERKQQKADKKARKQKQKTEAEKVGAQKQRKKSSINWHDRFIVDGKAVNRKGSKTESRRNSGWSRGVRKNSLQSATDDGPEGDEDDDINNAEATATESSSNAAGIAATDESETPPTSNHNSLTYSVDTSRSAAPSLSKIFGSPEPSIPQHPNAPKPPPPPPTRRSSVTGAPAPPPPPPPPVRRVSAPETAAAVAAATTAEASIPVSKPPPPPPSPRNSMTDSNESSPPLRPPPPPKESGASDSPLSTPPPATTFATTASPVAVVENADEDEDEEDDVLTVLKPTAGDSRRDSIMSDITESSHYSPTPPDQEKGGSGSGREDPLEREVGATVAPVIEAKPHYLDDPASDSNSSSNGGAVWSAAMVPKARPPPPPPPSAPRTPGGGNMLLKKPAPPPPKSNTAASDSPNTGQLDTSPLSGAVAGSRVNFSLNQGGGILDAIRRGSNLKKVDLDAEAERKKRESISSSGGGGGGGGLGALAKSDSVSAILERRKFLEGDSSDSEEDSDAGDEDWD